MSYQPATTDAYSVPPPNSSQYPEGNLPMAQGIPVNPSTYQVPAPNSLQNLGLPAGAEDAPIFLGATIGHNPFLSLADVVVFLDLPE
eukprot:CAMPEP_0196570782 /NCGR_PEP_ID=MMETSP1081-20130531/955_1 /TAXON_ID=36882 /ORGANISM="Pyramimonas amylifera, Strain CCMP720" /LENGTH=86 /DNA_ID=CAMNT_0041887429 /DNA_START=134 /DNA_END=398 /DNA_ORIENTATION=-